MRSTLLAALVLAGCATQPNDHDPQAIVDAAIAAHGGGALESAGLSFRFRGTSFSLTRDGGRFEYVRTSTDSLGRMIQDVVDNKGIHRSVDGVAVDIDSLTLRRIETDVNSVAYFALLPIPLNDPAVQKDYAGSQTIRGEPYDLVQVSFARDGGGRDYEDVFIYWFHSERHTMDFLAYSYVLGPNESGPNATGIRFREAGKVRDAGGFRVQDYRNFTADAGTDLATLGLLFEAGDLRLVSEVLLEDVRVEPLP